MKSLKEIALPVLSLLIICAVTASLLAYTNQITKDKIEENEIAELMNSRKVLIPNADNFAENTAEFEDELISYAVAQGKDGSILGYTFVTSMKGYAGDVGLMTAINSRGEILGVRILTIQETPGLGMKVADNSFLDKFKGKTRNISLSKNDDNFIEAISGATTSTRAVVDAVNKALDIYKNIEGVA